MRGKKKGKVGVCQYERNTKEGNGPSKRDMCGPES